MTRCPSLVTAFAVWLLTTLALAACAAPSAPAPAPKPAAASAPAPPSAPAAAQPPAAPAAPAAPAPTRDPLDAARLPERTRVVVGAPAGAALHVYIGLERGHFDALNLDVQLEDRLSSAETVAHLTSGDVDVANTSVAPGVFNAFVRGLPLKIVSDQTRFAPDGKSHVILARQELYDSGQLRTVEQLRGRRVGLTTPGSGLGIDLDRALRRAGLSIADVDQVQIPFQDQPLALANGAIDASVTFYPLASHATDRNVATPIRYVNEDYPEHQIAVTLIGTRLRERPDVGRAFLVGFLRGARDYERARRSGDNLDEVAAAIAKHSRLDPGVVAGYLRAGQMTAVDPDGRLNLDSIRYDLQWYRERGFVDADVNVSDYVDMQYADYAVGVLGPFR
jgi:NitT/TauT family transport system substrate-binding protein